MCAEKIKSRRVKVRVIGSSAKQCAPSEIKACHSSTKFIPIGHSTKCKDSSLLKGKFLTERVPRSTFISSLPSSKSKGLTDKSKFRTQLRHLESTKEARCWSVIRGDVMSLQVSIGLGIPWVSPPHSIRPFGPAGSMAWSCFSKGPSLPPERSSPCQTGLPTTLSHEACV